MLVLDIIKIDWEYVMLIGASFQLLMSLMVFLLLKEKPKKDEMLLSDDTESINVGRVAKFKQFIKFSREIARPHENKMYLLSMGLLKSILYGFLLWMPTYLSHR